MSTKSVLGILEMELRDQIESRRIPRTQPDANHADDDAAPPTAAYSRH